MFTPAAANKTILPSKKKLWAYFGALLEKSRLPVMTAMTKAPQVQGNTSAMSRVAARSSDAMPRSRRSMIEMVPTTRTMAST